MSDERKVPVVLLAREVVRPEAKLIEQLAMRQSQRADYMRVDSGAAALKFVNEMGFGVVFFVITAREDLVEVLNVLITLKPLLRAGQCKVFGFELLNSSKIHSVLMSKGCTEVLDPKVTPKTLQFKLERTLSSLKRSAKKSDDVSLGASRAARNEGRGAEADEAAGAKVDWADPQEFASDCWIVQKKSEVRFVNQHWFVKMIGPPPSAGKWEEGERQKWKWKPRSQPDPFITDEGAWVFVGKQPEFNWKTLKWQFVGKTPTLGFEVGGQVSFLRFEPREKTLWIRRNSETCKAHLAGIQRALAMESRFQKEGEGSAGGAKDYRAQIDGRDGPGNWSLAAEDQDFAEVGDATEENDEDFLGGWSGAGDAASAGAGGSLADTSRSARSGAGKDPGSSKFTKPGPDAEDFAVKLADESEGIDLSMDSEAAANLERMTAEVTLRLTLWPQTATLEAAAGAGTKVQLVDWMDDQIVVRLKADDAHAFEGEGGDCVIKAWLDMGKPAERIADLAKVELIERSDDGETLVTLRLPAAVVERLTVLMAAFEQRQASVKDFMVAARGY